MKKLRFHVPDSEGKSKCNKLHIGKTKMECEGLKVHGCLMKEVKKDTYLGDIISSDGKNTLNIESRISKVLGIVSQIMDVLWSALFLNSCYTERGNFFVIGWEIAHHYISVIKCILQSIKGY